jgi:hypothetical protein
MDSPYAERSKHFHKTAIVQPSTVVEGRQADHNHAMHGVDHAKIHRHDGKPQAGLKFDGGGQRRRVPEEPKQVAGKAPGPAKPPQIVMDSD